MVTAGGTPVNRRPPRSGRIESGMVTDAHD